MRASCKENHQDHSDFGRQCTCSQSTELFTIDCFLHQTEESVAQFYDGKPFNSPNDVIVKSDGSIWFTDPDYGCSVSEGHSSPVRPPFPYEISTVKPLYCGHR